jgi:hypothetical protein
MVIAAVIGGATFIWWVAAGSSLVALIDRFTTASLGERTAPARFSFDEGNDATAADPRFTFDDRSRVVARSWRGVERPAGRFSLETPEGVIELGAMVATSTIGTKQLSYVFAPDSGDVVSYTRRHSRLRWPRGLGINWYGTQTAKWGRYVYHRLVWRKPSGVTLDVAWRDEQRLQPASGWTDQYDSRPPSTRILK